MIHFQVRGDNFGGAGDVLATGEVGYEWDPRIEPAAFPLLGYVCPFTDTVFNPWQIEALMAELDRVPPEWDTGWVPVVRRLCELALLGSHRYLWCLGD